jgi:hypothetical protein
MKRNFVLLAILTLFILPAYFGDAIAAQKATKQKKPTVKKRTVQVVDLKSIEQLKEAFQKESGKVRLVTILSPT